MDRQIVIKLKLPGYITLNKNVLMESLLTSKVRPRNFLSPSYKMKRYKDCRDYNLIYSIVQEVLFDFFRYYFYMIDSISEKLYDDDKKRIINLKRK